MSWYQWVTEKVDDVKETAEDVYKKVSAGAGEVQEWFTGDENSDIDGVPGTNANTPAAQTPSKPINWTAASAIVGALALAARFIK